MGAGVSLYLPREGVNGASIFASFFSLISVPFDRELVSIYERILSGGFNLPEGDYISIPRKGSPVHVVSDPLSREHGSCGGNTMSDIRAAIVAAGWSDEASVVSSCADLRETDCAGLVPVQSKMGRGLTMRNRYPQKGASLPLNSHAGVGFPLLEGQFGAASSDARVLKVVSAAVSTNDGAGNAGCGIAAANDGSNVVLDGLASNLHGFMQPGAVPFRSGRVVTEPARAVDGVVVDADLAPTPMTTTGSLVLLSAGSDLALQISLKVFIGVRVYHENARAPVTVTARMTEFNRRRRMDRDAAGVLILQTRRLSLSGSRLAIERSDGRWWARFGFLLPVMVFARWKLRSCCKFFDIAHWESSNWFAGVFCRRYWAWLPARVKCLWGFRDRLLCYSLCVQIWT